MSEINTADFDHERWTAEKRVEWSTALDRVAEKGNIEILKMFLNEVLATAKALADAEDAAACLDLYEQCSKRIGGLFLDDHRSSLLALGMESYSAGRNAVAEAAFRILSEVSATGRNNYAYMIRRGEVTDSTEHPPLEALQLLREGITMRDAFSCVNTALTLALCFGTPKDWILADQLMSLLPDTDTTKISDWWADVARKGDAEGLLVHYFLLKYDKIKQSELGTPKDMAVRLSAKYEGFAEWVSLEL